MSRRKPVDPERLASAVSTLREVARQFPGTLLAAGAVAAIEVGKPALILEAAQVFGRRLEPDYRDGAKRWPVTGPAASV